MGLTAIPTPEAFQANIPEPSMFAKSDTRRMIIEALEEFAAEPWRSEALDRVETLSHQMIKKHWQQGAKYSYLFALIGKVKARKEEIRVRIERFRGNVETGGGGRGRGLRGVYAFEGQKHKGGVRLRASEFLAQYGGGPMGDDFTRIQARFQNPTQVHNALKSGDFTGVSDYDLYALKKAYKDQQIHKQMLAFNRLGWTTGHGVPYFTDEHRARILVTYEGTRVWQKTERLDTIAYTSEAGKELAMYAMALTGELFCLPPSGEPFKQWMRDLGYDKSYLPNHSSFLAGKQVASAGMLRAYQGSLTDINNDSGHYKPSARDLVRAISMIGATGDVSDLRAGAKIAEHYYYYFPADQVCAKTEQQLASNWADIPRKIIVDVGEYAELREANVGAPVPFQDLMRDFHDRTIERSTMHMYDFDYH
jgi:hypothetical protein